MAWKELAFLVVVCITLVLVVHSCNSSFVEIEKVRANKTHDINFGLGKNRN